MDCSGLSLVHDTDIAVMPIDNRDEISINFSLDDNLPVCNKGKVIIGREGSVDVGDVVYFDSRGACFIDELNLFIISKKSILLKEEEHG